MKNIRFLSLAVVVGLFVTSCVTESQKNDVKETVDNVNIEVIEKEEINVEAKNQPNKKGKKAKKENPKEQAPTIVEEPKVEEAPKEIGASPDAVYFLIAYRILFNIINTVNIIIIRLFNNNKRNTAVMLFNNIAVGIDKFNITGIIGYFNIYSDFCQQILQYN